MLIRIRSRDGNFRFELNPTDDGSVLYKKILETAPGADPKSFTISNKPRGGEVPLSSLNGRSITGLGFKHGDLLFVGFEIVEAAPASPPPDGAVAPPTGAGTKGPTATSSTSATRIWENVKEDEVDTHWRARDGKIPRKRDTNFCRHGPNAMCDYCMPLEPYDPKYHADHNIKHLSYHAYLRKLSPTNKPSAAASSTQNLPPLEPLSYKVKVPCPTESHPPYPGGICTACQPSSITLQSQSFRMVDHLEFSSPSLIDSFLQPWRHTGKQRFGWMIGKYAPYEEVPMGIKAVVEAIHEPPQDGDLDGLSLELPWEDQPRIEKLAKDGGLSVVGVIFTDLTPAKDDKSKTVCKRHQDSFFMSSLETIFAATLQVQRPTASKSSPSGQFASRLVTAILSGTAQGGIDVSAYMASEQACAMVDADMIEASVEPGMVRLKEPDEGRYIPDVFYRYKNEYKIDVKESAKPCFPVEYLLVNVTHGFPTTPSPAFLSTNFPIENRPGIEQQDISHIIGALSQMKASEVVPKQGGGERRKELVRYLSDWHLVAFLSNVGFLSPSDIRLLIKSVVAPDTNSPTVLDEFLQTEGWQTLMAIVQESSPARPSRPPPTSSAMDEDYIPPEVFDDIPDIPPDTGLRSGGTKTCPHCTFENPSSNMDCEVCGLPLSG